MVRSMGDPENLLAAWVAKQWSDSFEVQKTFPALTLPSLKGASFLVGLASNRLQPFEP